MPTAYIFGRCLRGIDIRKFGSGNVGATNAWRVLGKGPGISILILDIFKGFAAVFFLWHLIGAKITVISDEILRIILGLSCICGHNWTVFLRFKGGKGVATTLGVLLGLSVVIGSLKIIFGLTVLTWILMVLFFRIVSIASVLSGITLPIYMVVFKQSATLILSSVIIAIFIVLRHKSNLQRLFRGKEQPITFKKP
jgi:glycerol-3-phosphate acyltransferase PlsY